MATIEKLPPNNGELEEALLGSILINQDRLDYVMSILKTPKAFYRVKWQWVYKTICDIYNSSGDIDFLTICDVLEAEKQLDQVGGPAAITALINATPTSLHAETYAKKIRALYDRRMLIDAAGAIAQVAFDDSVEPTDAYIKATQIVSGVEPTGKEIRVTGGPGIDTAMINALHELNIEHDLIKKETISWPWQSMRNYIKSWRIGQPVVLIAEGGAGKTAFAMEIAGHNAQNGAKVFYAHTEDEPKTLLVRRLSTISGISFSELESGTYNSERKLISISFEGQSITAPEKVFSVLSSVKGWTGELYLVDVSGMTMPEAIYELRRLEREVGKPDIVIYDWFFDHAMRPGRENVTMKLTLDQQDFKNYSNKHTRVLLVMQTGKTGAGKNLTAYDAFYTSSAAHYGKTVLTMKRERELVNGDPIGAFKPEMKILIAKSNLDRTGMFTLAMNGETFRIYEPYPMSEYTKSLGRGRDE